MSTIQDNIFTLLEGSSLPGLYKSLLKNLVPSMSQVQLENMLLILAKEDSDKRVLQTEMKKTFHQYSSLLDRLEDNPNEFDKVLNLIPPEVREKMDAELNGNSMTKTKDAARASLSSIKQKVDLESLKQQINS